MTRNFALEYRWAKDRKDQAEALAREMEEREAKKAKAKLYSPYGE